jgi:hypothetical protein
VNRLLWSFVVASLAGCGAPIQMQTYPDERPAYRPLAGQKYTYAVANSAGVPAVDLRYFDDRLRRRLLTSGRLGASGDELTRSVEIEITKYMFYDNSSADPSMPNILSSITIREAQTGQVVATFNVQSAGTVVLSGALRPIETHADRIVSALLAGG